MRTNKGYTRLSRHLAGLIAFLFAFVSVIASQHSHSQRNETSVETSATLFPVSETVTHSDSTPHSAASFSEADCASCDWLATGITTPGTVATIVPVSFSTAVILLLQVRIAALCAAPTPRQGLRAPPLAFV
ncbi:MAG: DUF2946 family protein [Fibrella sp.]|nr:DUF2946 family protein [Armatimonadota bacterium]